MKKILFYTAFMGVLLSALVLNACQKAVKCPSYMTPKEFASYNEKKQRDGGKRYQKGTPARKKY